MEQLVASACLLQSDGKLRVSTPLVDDEGVDLVVSHRETDNTLFLQVKSRFNLNRGNYRTQVRRAALRAGAKRFLLFVYYDAAQAVMGETMWLVPSLTFEKLLSGQKRSSRIYVFQSRFTSQHDMWKPYRISRQALASSLIDHL
ncbi:MAG: hypothetical protein HYZ89_05435 [Candidatus Omnitrophica bacterium]|nr:hypothetical protein [Candidatus Omnitrophota bacterium]